MSTMASTSGATPSSSTSGDSGVTSCERQVAVEWFVDGREIGASLIAAAATSVGDLAIVATKDALVDDDLTDVVVELRDPAGTVQWSDVYAGSNALADLALDVAVDDLGDVYVLLRETISVEPSSPKMNRVDARLVVLHYDGAGERVWRWESERRTEGDVYRPGGDIEVVGDRVVVLEDEIGPTRWLVELDSTGHLVSEVGLVIEDNPKIAARDVARSGQVAFIGMVGEPDAQVIRAVRFDRDGALKWSQTFGTNDDRASGIIAGPSGETYVAWSTATPGVDATMYLRRLDGYGGEAWTEPLLVTHPDPQPLAGDVAEDGSVLVTTKYPIVPMPDALDRDFNQPLWVARYGAEGCRIWRLEHDFPQPYGNGEGHVIVDASGGSALVLASYVSYGSAAAPWIGLVAE